MSIRLKLLAVFLAIAAASLGLALLATYRAAAMVAERRVTEELGRTVEQVGEELVSLQDRYRLAVNELVKSPYMLEALGRGNNIDADLGLADPEETLLQLAEGNTLMASADLSLLKEGRGRDRNDVIVLLNARRSVIYTVADQEVFGRELQGLEVVEAALQGRSAIELWSSAQVAALPIPLLDPPLESDDFLFVIATPILKRESVEGVLLTGRRASRLLAAQGMEGQGEEGRRRATGQDAVVQAASAVGRADGGGSGPELADGSERSGRAGAHGDAAAPDEPMPEVVLVARDGAVATRMPGLGEALKAAGLEATALDLGEKRLLVQRRALEVGGARALGDVYVLKDPEAEVRGMLGAFRMAVIPSALAVLLLAGLAAAWLAARLARPLVQLEEAALRVRRGELEVHVEPGSQDEVGRLAVAFNEMVAGLRQRDQIKGLFKRYLAPQVVDELLRHPDKAMPGGERRVLSVLFADLVGFTSMSERLEPEVLVSLLNRYFEEATQVLSEHGATLDKFIGDAIMCFWNAPLPHDEHAAQACRTALALVQVVDRLAPEFAARGVGAAGRPDRRQHRRLHRRQHRLARGAGLHRDGRCGEPRLAARGRLQELPRPHAGLRGGARARPGPASPPASSIWCGSRDGSSRCGSSSCSPRRGRASRRSARYGQGLALYRARRFAEAAELLATPPRRWSRAGAARALCAPWSARRPPRLGRRLVAGQVGTPGEADGSGVRERFAWVRGEWGLRRHT